MKIVELREKTDKELETLLSDARSAVRQARFKVAFKQLKNVRELRVQKRLIAKVLTLLRMRKSS